MVRFTFDSSICLAAITCAAVALPAQALTLTPGTIIAENSDLPIELVKYSTTGSILETLALSNSTSLGVIDGLAVVGSGVYVVGTSGPVGSVDLTTGAVTPIFTPPTSTTGTGPESLGNIGNDLLVNRYNGAEVYRYSTSGTLLSTITLSTLRGLTGLDSDGTRLYGGDYTTGNIYTYDLAGVELGSFSTGLGANRISGLGYDSATNSLWVSFGFGDDTIRQYSLTGTQLASFPSNRSFIDGLDVVPAVPEPAGLIALAGITALGLRRRRSTGSGV